MKCSITNKQIAFIWQMVKGLGWEEEDLRDLIEKISGQRRLHGLNREQVNILITRLKERCRRRGVLVFMNATKWQKKALFRLKEQIQDHGVSEEAFHKWLRKYFSLESLDDPMTTKMAQKVQHGMISWLRNLAKKYGNQQRRSYGQA